MARNNVISEKEAFKNEFKTHVHDQAKMLYRKTLEELPPPK